MKLSAVNIFRLAALIFLSVGHSFAEDVKVWLSPNHTYRAVVKTVFGPPEAYQNYQVINFFDQKQHLLAKLSLEEGSGINRAVIEEAAWSPDSRFFVFETISSGGHSIWHMPTYVYDASTSLIYSVDDSLGAIASSNRKLKFTATNAIQLEFYNMEGGGSDPFSFPKTVSLPVFVEKGKVALNSIRLDTNAPHHR
jgi:hypothetical protein